MKIYKVMNFHPQKNARTYPALVWPNDFEEYSAKKRLAKVESIASSYPNVVRYARPGSQVTGLSITSRRMAAVGDLLTAMSISEVTVKDM
jgi:hypothetical protein